MPLQFLQRWSMRPRRAGFARNYRVSRLADLDSRRVGDESKAYLPTAGKFNIDLGEQLRIEQRAMLDA